VEAPLSLNVLDLFSGAGGLALGFSAEGGRCVGAVEHDGSAARTFRRNFVSESPRVFGGPEEGDVNNLGVRELLDGLSATPDIVTGGPPCQGFSRIGRAKQISLLDEDLRVLRGVRDPNRNQLYRYFLGVVAVARPAAFVMENVPGMREMLGIDHAGRIAREASALGYNVRYFLLNAAWYGVPQDRWRLFFVGLRGDLGPRNPEPPVRTHRSVNGWHEGAALPDDPQMLWGDAIPVAKRRKAAVTVFEALQDLPRLTGHLAHDGHKAEPPREQARPLRRTPSKWAQELRAWPGLPAPDLVTGNWYRWTPRDFGTFAGMAHGDRYPRALWVANERLQRALDEAGEDVDAAELRKDIVPPYRNDAFVDKWRKLKLDAPSWTVTAHLGKDTYSHIHYDSRQARTITIREAARLQSFPDGFEFEGNMGQRYRQIGNAVPPLLARAIARQLLGQLKELGVGPA
jgi:DNA (cytosine-5)-methyltransferase 1